MSGDDTNKLTSEAYALMGLGAGIVLGAWMMGVGTVQLTLAFGATYLLGGLSLYLLVRRYKAHAWSIIQRVQIGVGFIIGAGIGVMAGIVIFESYPVGIIIGVLLGLFIAWRMHVEMKRQEAKEEMTVTADDGE
jgi:hypothetical protein